MDRDTRARVAEAKRELTELLQSLAPRPADAPTGTRQPVTIFTGAVTIVRFIQYTQGGHTPCDS